MAGMEMNAYELAEDTLHMLQSWSEAYPTDIFPEVTQTDIDFINSQNERLSGRFFAYAGRHFIKKGFEPAIKTIQQLVECIADLEKEKIRAYDNGYEDGQKSLTSNYKYDPDTGEPLIDGYPLYSGLPTPQTKPLSDEKIEVCYWGDGYPDNPRSPLEFARAIEERHGIK